VVEGGDVRRSIAIGGFAATVLLAVAGVLLTTATTDWIANLIVGTWLCFFGAIAMVIVLRLPDNLVGRLMLSFTVAMTLSLAAASYGQYVYEFGHRDLPWGDIAAWISLWLPLPALGLLLFVFLRFPNGDLPSPRWRYVERLAALALLVGALGLAFRPGPVDAVQVAEPDGFGEASLPNPFGVDWWRGFSTFSEQVGENVLAFCILATVVSLILRFRRADGEGRRQMKWLVLAVALFPVFFFVAEFVGAIENTEEDVFSFLILMLAAFMVPTAMGVAILKYRLYDIDVIVNRALVYATMTGLIGAFYLGLVVALQTILDPVTQDSDLAVAASTLAAAALVRPLRARIQGFIDRRFYRRKYDAARTLAALTRRLRDEVDLSVVGSDVVKVVKDTVQPAHVGLWMPGKGAS
jgi:hypothetical protein